jgi:hypothetical protein
MSSVVQDSVLIYLTPRRRAYLFMHVGHESEPTTLHVILRNHCSFAMFFFLRDPYEKKSLIFYYHN